MQDSFSRYLSFGFCFQRLKLVKVATILHCLNHFLLTRGCNSHVRERCKLVKRSHRKHVYPQCNTVVHVKRSVCDCGHAFASKKRKARCTAVGELAVGSLLAHSSTVKLSPCPCSHSSPAGRIAACRRVFQIQFATRSGSPQDDSASF